MDTIIKRDGTKVPFDFSRIFNAISAAARDAAEKAGKPFMRDGDIHIVTAFVVDGLEKAENEGVTPTVEACQDLVEKTLMERGFTEVAKNYILYRAEHAKMRNASGQLVNVFNELTNKRASDVDLKRENANIDADTSMGTMLKFGSEAAKWYLDSTILPKDISAAHANGDIHIHDKDFYLLTETCCQIDLRKLFHGGFSTGHGFLREPNSIESYAALACIAIQANQNEMHGGQSVPAFDYDMAEGVVKTWNKEFAASLSDVLDLSSAEAATEYLLPHIQEVVGTTREGVLNFINSNGKLKEYHFGEEKISRRDLLSWVVWAFDKADKKTTKRTHQAMESFIHNLNTMASRAGAQVPFSSINYGTCTSWEGRLVIEQLYKATEEGLGRGETAIFPVQIFKVKEGVNFNPGDPNYDLFKRAIEVSSKRLFPNFEFLDAPFNLQYYKPGHPETEVATMGCRTRVMGNVNGEETTPGRGNLSFTTINLPRLGIEAHGDIGLFYNLLDKRLELVGRQLLHRYAIQAKKQVLNYPFLMGNGVWRDADKLTWEDKVGEILKHGTLSVGFIGLAECLVALTGKHHGESEVSQRIGLEIIGHMREFCDEMTRKHHMNFTLIGTPAEGLAGRFTRLDRQRYGERKGITDREYYTNSSHVPVYYEISAADKIAIEAPYHALCNAGHICYVELDGDTARNTEAFESIIRYMQKMHVGYGSVNHPLDRDPVCGYVGVINDVCPRCGRREGEGVSEEKLREIRKNFPHALNDSMLFERP